MTSGNAVRRLLVVKPSSLGDIFHVFPALELLRRAYPEAELDFLVHPAFQEVLDYSPFPVRRRILFNRAALGRLRSFGPEFFRLTRELRKERYDLVIDFQGLFRSAFFAALAAGSRPVGFAHPREGAARWFYRAGLPVPRAAHAVVRNVALVNALLGTDSPVPVLRLPVSERHAAMVGKLLDASGIAPGTPLVGVMPGARWISKAFPPRLFREVLQKAALQRPDLRFVLIGAPSDAAAGREVGENFPGMTDLIGRTSLGEMVELIRRCGAVLSNDSGPVHAAAALGVPAVCFFGPTNAELTGPYGECHKILRLELPCAPCMSRRCPLYTAPACHNIDSSFAAAELLSAMSRGVDPSGVEG